ncbi:carotenoid oxygenase [Phascolomyces articulosus]|uniref:Carotenoid oxygenase n=1 Tax=Phascolomyces articulosus TaxID=60185 RepID=A0AAD5KNY1_9FUNG|nr:carotenoid oxygenase [Phascolomyces articulosus]
MLYIVFSVLAFIGGYKLVSSLRRIFQLTDQIKDIQQNNVFRNAKEVPEPIWIPTHGTIPQWLSGIMYRIGPGKYTLDGNKYMIKHAFDGLPFMHRFEISSEKQAVRYNARNLAGSLERQLVGQRAKSSVFFGHVQDLSILDRCVAIVSRIREIVFTGIINRKDPSSASVGVTPTPNFPMPTHWLERSKEVLGEYHLVSKTDLNVLQQVHANTLEPKRLYNYGDYDERLNGDLSASHHQYDPITEESFNYTIKLGPISKLTVFAISRSGHVTILAEITHRRLPGGTNNNSNTRIRPSFIHAFMLTQNYVIIPESPLYYNDADILFSGSAVGSYIWDEKSPTYFHIISRSPEVGHVISIPVDNFFSFHHANAWDTIDDENGNPTIILDTCAFSNADIVYQLHSFGTYLRGPNQYHHPSHLTTTPTKKQTRPMGMSFPPIRQSSFGDLRRYQLSWDRDLNTGTGSYRTIAQNIEFPRFSQYYALRKNRYVWGCQLLTPNTEEEAERYILVKANLESGTLVLYNKPRYSCSEPIFVPKKSATKIEKDEKDEDEDEGAIISLVNIVGKNAPEEDSSFLLILNARNMEEMARCDIGKYNISTFHGSYINSDFQNVSIN